MQSGSEAFRGLMLPRQLSSLIWRPLAKDLMPVEKLVVMLVVQTW